MRWSSVRMWMRSSPSECCTEAHSASSLALLKTDANMQQPWARTWQAYAHRQWSWA